MKHAPETQASDPSRAIPRLRSVGPMHLGRYRARNFLSWKVARTD